MFLSGTNLVCGSSVKQCNTTTSIGFHMSDSSARIVIIVFRRVFDYIVYICMISWSVLYCDTTCFINIWYSFCKLAYALLFVCLLCIVFVFWHDHLISMSMWRCMCRNIFDYHLLYVYLFANYVEEVWKLFKGNLLCS